MTGKFLVKCVGCNETIERINGKKKELHNFKNGKCKDCGYKVKKCEHEETEDVVSYWYNDVNERGNDASYVEYNIICTYCNVKVDSKVHYGPVTAIKISSSCDHDDVDEIAVMTYYEPSTEEMHYKLTKYIVKCLECKEEFNNYTEEREYKHEIENGKCTKCIYESKKVSNGTNSKVSNAQSSEAGNLKVNTSDKTTKTENSQNVASKVTYEKSSSSSNENKITETIESFFISTEYSNYSVNGESISWKSVPREINDTLQVPLREFAEQMGFEVTWDSKNNYVYVDDGKTIKTFIPDDILCVIDYGNKTVGKRMKNKSQIVDGVFYADLDGLLEGTEYSYYKSETTYRIGNREEIINRVAIDKLTGYNKLTAPDSLYEDSDYTATFTEEAQYYVVEKEDGSFWVTVIVPIAQQGFYGNYYDGDATVGGILCRIIVGELPIAGTAADIRDAVSHIGEPECTMDTIVDVAAIFPVAGLAKYIPELTKASKNSDQVLEGLEVVTDLSKNADNVTGSITHADELVKSANKTGSVTEITKNTDDTILVAKASIKSVEDLKKLTKHPEIYAENTLEHIFYGNSKGGFHYKGLSGTNGSIDEITKAPNKYGVYEAEVSIVGKNKTKTNTFFPDDWTPEEVIEAIEEAYSNGVYDQVLNNRIYTMKSGMKIQVNLNDAGEIVSAYPLYK